MLSTRQNTFQTPVSTLVVKNSCCNLISMGTVRVSFDIRYFVGVQPYQSKPIITPFALWKCVCKDVILRESTHVLYININFEWLFYKLQSMFGIPLGTLVLWKFIKLYTRTFCPHRFITGDVSIHNLQFNSFIRQLLTKIYLFILYSVLFYFSYT